MLFKQWAYAFVLSVFMVQSNLPNVCTLFINTVQKIPFQKSCTVSHAPNILTFIFLTRQTCEVKIGQFQNKKVMKRDISEYILVNLFISTCFLTHGLTPDVNDIPLMSKPEQTIFQRATITRNIWWAHTIKPKTPIENIAYTMPKYPNIGFFAVLTTMWLIIPNPGKISKGSERIFLTEL